MACTHTLLRSLGNGRCPHCEPVQAVFRRDGWQNIATGIGVANVDKRTAGAVRVDYVSATEARDLWTCNDLAARIIEAGPADELRGGLVLTMEDKELASKILAGFESLQGPEFIGKGATANVIKTRCFENAYGGGAIWPVINDGSDLSEPLDEKAIPKIERLQVFEPRELRPSRYYPPDDPKAGEISHYQVMPINGARMGDVMIEMHESRLITFPGIRVTREESIGTEYGWGHNKLTRVKAALNDLELTFASAAHLVQDFSQAILKLDGLAEILGQDGQNEASGRLSEMNRWRSVLRAVVIDGKDSFERVTTNLTGLPDMADRFIWRLCAAARMPATKLMGISPAGMNATGESDNENWDEEVSQGRTHVLPRLERLLRLYMLAADSPTGGKEPAQWSVGFKPLREPDQATTLSNRKLQMEIDTGYIDAQVYSPEETAEARFGGDEYSHEMMIKFKDREASPADAAALEAEARAANATGSKAPPPGVPAANGLAGANGSVQTTAFNGAQVQAMVNVIKEAVSKQIPRESAQAILEIAFPVTTAQAKSMLGPDNWAPEPKAPAPAFGGGPPAAPPKPPGAPKPPNMIEPDDADEDEDAKPRG